jgi:hypothetical protein
MKIFIRLSLLLAKKPSCQDTSSRSLFGLSIAWLVHRLANILFVHSFFMNHLPGRSWWCPIDRCIFGFHRLSHHRHAWFGRSDRLRRPYNVPSIICPLLVNPITLAILSASCSSISYCASSICGRPWLLIRMLLCRTTCMMCVKVAQGLFILSGSWP